MKNIFYYLFLSFLFSSSLFANELDEELIDKKFNQIKTTEFCTTNEWSEIEKKDFVAAFILGWYWEIKEADESDKIDKQSFNKLFNEVCGKKSLLIENLENLIIKNNIVLNKPYSSIYNKKIHIIGSIYPKITLLFFKRSLIL